MIAVVRFGLMHKMHCLNPAQNIMLSGKFFNSAHPRLFSTNLKSATAAGMKRVIRSTGACWSWLAGCGRLMQQCHDKNKTDFTCASWTGSWTRRRVRKGRIAATSLTMPGMIGEGLHVQSSTSTEKAMDDHPNSPQLHLELLDGT